MVSIFYLLFSNLSILFEADVGILFTGLGVDVRVRSVGLGARVF